MTDGKLNLLHEGLITTAPLGGLSLPGVLAALSRDEVDSFPALRPHQAPLWHMFLVQLAALALHRAGDQEIPADEETWRRLLRGLTSKFPNDEPWCLVVEDRSKPAFMQPPVPKGVSLDKSVPSPDALDLLITSKNHDLKQAIARAGQPEDWIFALVSLQTGEGYGGAGNQGISRMNGGSSSRPMMSLAPVSQSRTKELAPRAGVWFQRDLRVLIETREAILAEMPFGYPCVDGVGLTWLEIWNEGEQLELRNLDIWFIEVCRRTRLSIRENAIIGSKGTSKSTRINAKQFKGAVGDPWAPVHRVENKNFTLSGGDFDYRTVVTLFLSGDWSRPLLANPASFEDQQTTLALIMAALSRGNSKTEGFKSRIIPIGGKIIRSLGPRRSELHELAQDQISIIKDFDKALSNALVLIAARGDSEKINQNLYPLTRSARDHLDRYADEIFFEHLWAAFEAQEAGAEALKAEQQAFAAALWKRTQPIFYQFLPSMPCPGLYRPRAEARAVRKLEASVRKAHPELFSFSATSKMNREGETDAT